MRFVCIRLGGCIKLNSVGVRKTGRKAKNRTVDYEGGQGE